MGWYYGFRPYVSVAKRRANAAREMARLAKKGQIITPVKLDGNKIVTTFWGKAWCENLESYSDFSNRLPRGRTYVRNGSVVDLQIDAGSVNARVSGSDLYQVKIEIEPVIAKVWSRLKQECGGQIKSLIELLQGRLSQGVMELVTRHDGGLFPSPAEIDMQCSCPDYAGMCKHIAAVMYGIGARLDQQPELLFKLRKVDHLELIDSAGVETISAKATSKETIAAGDLADVFGIELDTLPAPETADVPPASGTQKNRRRAHGRPGTPTVAAAAAATNAPRGADTKASPRHGKKSPRRSTPGKVERTQPKKTTVHSTIKPRSREARRVGHP